LESLAYKDAVYFSPHKMLGGPGSSGILIAKKNVLFQKKPFRFGGGIVLYVNELDQEYVGNVEELEESGTPGIIQDIRAALAFQLKEAVSCETIKEREIRINGIVRDRFSKIPNIHLNGNNNKHKSCIYTFLVKAPNQRFLHSSYVSTLLNDLFGI
jgi:selenocysteine lyase/cysteine desulfurase